MRLSIVRTLASLFALAPLLTHASMDSLESTYRFLVSPRSPARGALGTVQGKAAPFSFFTTAEYWGAYVCALPNHSCAVTDVYNAADYTLTPAVGVPGDLQVERVNTHNGSNIYDAATWQIAVMLGAVKHGFGAGANAYELASNQNHLLRVPARRALTAGPTFAYNGTAITDPTRAYAFRMLSERYVAVDPLAGSRYASLIRAQGLPIGNPDYAKGRITWTDWKPFTGENAWAFLLGPLQAAYIHHVIERREKAVPWTDLAMRNALVVLPTFATMQSAVGGVYYSPSGTFANQGKALVSPYFVSVENNASLYAGLQVLRATLEAQLKYAGLTTEQQAEARRALELIRVMVNGGSLNTGRSTAGLLAFFKQAAWRDGEFVQGGYANDPARGEAWVPVHAPRAVDANTWTIAALGPRRVDAWFGEGASFTAWERVKAWGGYGQGSMLWGVGFSDQDGNGRDERGAYRQGVLSAEWTAGAITMARRLAQHYGASKNAAAHRYVSVLAQDEVAMLKGVQSLRYDQYLRSALPGKPQRYAELIPQQTLPYLYASRRAFVPFGWEANPIPSTCATAWMIMLASRYDPFRYGGGIR